MKNVAKPRGTTDGNGEKDRVEKMEIELRRSEAFMHKFSEGAVDWAQGMKHLMTSLSMWADAFGSAIGIPPDSEAPEAFNAFKMVLRTQIIPICEDLEKVIRETLLPQLSLLADSMNNPLRHLEAMRTLGPLHYGLLNLDASKSRPPASLLEASKSYVALRERLHTELPPYLALLQKGINAIIAQMSACQVAFYKDTHTYWSNLSDALRIEEGSDISSAPETVRIWREKFSIVDERLSELWILKRLRDPDLSPAVGIAETPRMSSNSSLEQVETPTDIPSPALIPGSAFVTGHTPRLVETSLPAQHVQHSQEVRPQSPLQLQPQLRTSIKPYSPINRGNYHSQSSSVVVNAEDPYFVSEVAGTRRNVRRDSLSLSSLKRFSGSSRLTSPSPSPASPRSFAQQQQQVHGRSRSLSRSRPATPHTPSYPTYPTSPPLTTTRSSISSGSQDARITPVLYACEAICLLHPNQDALYEGIGFHRLEVGMRLGILQEFGHPRMHPELPLYIDDGDDCLLLAVDIYENIGWAFASFLIPVD